MILAIPFPEVIFLGPYLPHWSRSSFPHTWDTALVRTLIPTLSFQAYSSYRQVPRIFLLKYCSCVTASLRTDNDYILGVSFKPKFFNPINFLVEPRTSFFFLLPYIFLLGIFYWPLFTHPFISLPLRPSSKLSFSSKSPLCLPFPLINSL